MRDIKEKIAKLLALADSPEEHEARAALIKARQLMAEHKLREEDIHLSGEATVIRRTVGITCSKRKNSWAVRLAAVIAEHYCCKSYRARQYGKQTVAIGFIGLEEDFGICEAIFRYAYDCVAAECDNIRKQNRDAYAPSYLTKITDAYGSGFINGLKEAFDKQAREHQEWGLVLVTPEAVQAEWDRMGKPVSFKTIGIDGEKMKFARAGYQDGLEFDPGTKLDAAALDSDH